MTAPKTDEFVWQSNASRQDIAKRLRGVQNVAIFTHAKPDGDSTGSSLALARALTHAGIRAIPVYVDPWLERFTEILGETPVLHESGGAFDDAFLQTVDTAVIVDTGSWGQVAGAGDWIRDHLDRVIIIDHHAHGDIPAPMRLIDTAAAAACEIVADVCTMLLDDRSPSELPADVAHALYLGIATDTGWFKHSNVTPNVLRLAGDLLAAGVDHTRLVRIIEQSDERARIHAIATALATLEYHGDGRFAVLGLDHHAITSNGFTLDHLGGLTDLPMSVSSVRAAAALTEIEPGLTKVSFRSKTNPDSVNVNEVAQTLDGGGHKHAAGAKIRAPYAEARERVIAALTDAETLGNA
ncbi:MAG: bifunctional oligoribonuclease/PAP phosphatase NrnA [Planctomycetota bacterium]